MKKEDLIKKLQEYPDGTEIVVERQGDGDFYFERYLMLTWEDELDGANKKIGEVLVISSVY